ncbi:MAG TPA: hypothetical protein VE131_15270, partial [Terriglobales bacterium]|nr:hypothetical protein [Terriglobales bacterium]
MAAAILSVIAMRQLTRADARRWARRALELTKNHEDLSLRAITCLNWLIYYQNIGEFSEGNQVIDEMQHLLKRRDLSPIAGANAAMTILAHDLLSGDPGYRGTVDCFLDLAQKKGMANWVI